MKQTKLLIVLFLTILGLSPAYAGVVSPYKVDFNTAISTSSHDFAVASGWGHIVSSYFDEDTYDNLYPTYTYSSTAGRDGSGALKVSDQKYVGSGYGESPTTDLLVTPAITGKASIYVKKTASSGTVKFYTVTTNSDGSFSTGSVITVTLPELSTSDYVKVDIPSQSNAHIGIYGSNVWLDDFEADSVTIEQTRKLKLSSVTNVLYRGSTRGEEDVDASGYFGIKFKVTLVNSGDVDFLPTDSDFSISIYNYTQKAVVATVPVTQKLAAGDTLTDYEVVAQVPYASYPSRNRYDVQENVGGTSTYGYWIEPVAYKPVPHVADSEGTVDSGTTQAFGMISQPTTKSYTLSNRGAAPMTFASIDVPDGFTTTLNAADTIAAHESKTFAITATTATTGVHTGNLVMKFNGANDFVLPLTATVLDTTKFFINFEDGKFPQGFIVGKNWEVKQRDYLSSDNAYMASSSLVDDTKLITPLLKVAEGEKMSVDVAKTGYTSTYSHLNVYYSADRKNWTLARAIANSELASTRGVSSYFYGALKNFVIDSIPAGNYYIAFEAGYASVDNIYGFERVDVDHDVYYTAVDMPATGTVNNEYTATATVKNNNNKPEAAGSYSVELELGGKTMATAEAPAMAADTTMAFTFAFTPHEAGTYPAVIVYKSGDYVVASDTVEVTIGAESASTVVQVGNVAGASSDYATPINVYYKYSVSDVIYTQKLLEAAGVKKGDKIVNVSFKGYNTAGEVSTDVQAWIGNTADTAYVSDYTVPDTTTLTKIANKNYTVPVIGSSSDHQVMLSIDIPEGFVYNGESIKMVTGSAITTAYKRAYFEYSNENPIGYSKRGDSKFEWNTATTTSYMPVPYFTIEKQPATLSGTVTSAAGPVSNAKVELRNGDVLYSAQSGADGTYSMTVVQYGKKYAMTVTADGYQPYTDSVAFDSLNIVKNVVLTLAPDTIVVPESGWTTYSNTHAIAIGDNTNAAFTVYAVTSVTGEGAVISAYDRAQGIPAGTGVLINAPAGTYVFERQAATSASGAPAKAEETVTNLLTPTLTAAYVTTGTDNAYVLDQNTSGVNGFRKADAGETVEAYKAYLVVTGTEVADFYPLTTTTVPTGIDEVNTTAKSLDVNQPMYDLNGRRVGADYKGVVVQKGLKVLRK